MENRVRHNDRKAMERIRAREWRRLNPEKVRAQKQRYYAKNRERLTAYRRAWALANSVRFKEMRATWQRENPEKVREYRRIIRKRRSAKHAEYMRLWRKKNPELIKEIETRSYLKKRAKLLSLRAERAKIDRDLVEERKLRLVRDPLSDFRKNEIYEKLLMIIPKSIRADDRLEIVSIAYLALMDGIIPLDFTAGDIAKAISEQRRQNAMRHNRSLDELVGSNLRLGQVLGVF